MEPPITRDEVRLAAPDLPMNKAPGRDRIPAEFYRHLPVLLHVLPGMRTHMIETNQIPEVACRYHIPPFDKARQNPSQRNGKRPISLLNSYMKLLELVVVRRLMEVLEPSLTDCQYAHQRQRSPNCS